VTEDVSLEGAAHIASCDSPPISPVKIHAIDTSMPLIDDAAATAAETPTEKPLETGGIPSMTRSSTKASRAGSSSIRSIGTRISSRLSQSLRHVNSVLSATNSWTSDLAYTSSFSTGRVSSIKRQSSIGYEFMNWDNLEDTLTFSDEAIHCPEISLDWRPCCNYFGEMPALGTECATCGTKEVHHLARSKKGSEITSMDIDRFGNTTLHHAAAAGNLSSIAQFLKTYGSIPKTQPFSRNTSGETFLHVLRFNDPSNFETFLEILKCAVLLGFSFSTRDDYGRNITQKFLGYARDWYIDVNQLREAQEILEAK
jgi:hypothetical protein